MATINNFEMLVRCANRKDDTGVKHMIEWGVRDRMNDESACRVSVGNTVNENYKDK